MWSACRACLLMLVCSSVMSADRPDPDSAATAETVEAELLIQLETNRRDAEAQGASLTAARCERAMLSYLWDGGSAGDVVAQVPPELRIRWEGALRQARDARLAALGAERQQALDGGDVPRADNLQSQIETLESESDPARWTGIVARQVTSEPYTWEDGGRLGSAAGPKLPDVLECATFVNRFVIRGEFPATLPSFGQRTGGHFGKLVLWDVEPRRGLLAVNEPTGADATTYFFCVEQSGRVPVQLSLWLERDRLYRWRIDLEDDGDFSTFVLESGDGTVEHRVRFRRVKGQRCGFAATVRRPDDAAELAVAFAPLIDE